MNTRNTAPNGFPVVSLLDAAAFPHEVTKPQLKETHISWVVLTGEFAYKIKKPVHFPFVDYSTLAARRDFCFREVTLNRRFSAEIYLGVVGIFRRGSELHVGDSHLSVEQAEASDAIEFAVKMREFPQPAIAAALLKRDALDSGRVEAFGRELARLHTNLETAGVTNRYAQIEGVATAALENFTTLLPAFRPTGRIQRLKAMDRWTIAQLPELRSRLQQRLTDGRVRRCHGDLHLNNVVEIDRRLMPFDGVEFNESLQWIDVLSEIAFPAMDFVARGRSDLGWRFLNAYLEESDDYRDLAVLRFYLVYRAMVRAKVAWLNPANHPKESQLTDGSASTRQPPPGAAWDKYLDTAWFFAMEMRPALTIMHGFSGSGKSTVARQLVTESGGIHLRSDVLRQKISRDSTDGNVYTPDARRRVYRELLQLARCLLQGGFPVIVDATFLQRADRQCFAQLADELGIGFQIAHCDAPLDELCQRIRDRGPDPSEATAEVVRAQVANHDPLTTDEWKRTRRVNS